MQSAEIELKFPVSDPVAFQSRLHGLGFHLETPRTFEQNTLFDTPSRDLLARREILRIRQYGDLCFGFGEVQGLPRQRSLPGARARTLLRPRPYHNRLRRRQTVDLPRR